MSTTQPIRSKQLLHDFKNYYLTEQPEFRNYTIILIGLNTALRIMKRFVKCFFELLTQIIVKVRKCKVQRVCVLHFQLAGSGGCFFLMKLYH